MYRWYAWCRQNRGLSTANGLVFGKIAGKSASRYASSKSLSEKEEVEFEVYEIEGAEDLILEVQEIMFKNAMIEKSEVGVKDSLLKLEGISKGFVCKKEVNMENLRNSYRLENNILLCKAILKAIDLRKEKVEVLTIDMIIQIVIKTWIR